MNRTIDNLEAELAQYEHDLSVFLANDQVDIINNKDDEDHFHYLNEQIFSLVGEINSLLQIEEIEDEEKI